MRFNYLCWHFFFGLLTLTSVAKADIISVTGSWNFTINGQGFTDQMFTGTASFDFDNSTLLGAGRNTLTSIGLDSFSLTPSTIGLTEFNISNTTGHVEFLDGELAFIAVGGTVDGTDNINGSGSVDDFYVFQNITNPAVGAFVSAGSSNGSAGGVDPSVSFAAVPEPSSILCLSMLGIGFLYTRRKRNRLANLSSVDSTPHQQE